LVCGARRHFLPYDPAMTIRSDGSGETSRLREPDRSVKVRPRRGKADMITRRQLGYLAAAPFVFRAPATAGDDGRNRLEQVVSDAIRPVMEEYAVPGMAIAVTVRGGRSFLNFGVASKRTGQGVTEKTLFEIGSVSKTFTAILASYAQAIGALSLSDTASRYMPALAGSSFDRISLLDLGAYAAGGLPLQFPRNVVDEKSMIAYFRNWRPSYPPGAYRLYSNPSIGLFGHLAAASMGRPFDDLMEHTLFPMLGLKQTWIRIPRNQMGAYAEGYSKAGRPIRMRPGPLGSEAYGVRTTAADMIRFVEANMNGAGLDETLQRAIEGTHAGYFRIGDMIQGLGWEMYDDPTDLGRLLAGNSPEMALRPNRATRIDPPLRPRTTGLINKTGSTNGFGAYVAYLPARSIGIVMLANRNFPIPARVKAAHRILMALDGGAGPTGSR
jgi:beta-lactamase class C